MACSHVKNCELFVQFALNPALDIWKDNYCEGNFAACARYQQSKTGRLIPLTLLPNGATVNVSGDDTQCGSIAIFNAILKKRLRMVTSLIKIGIDINEKNIDGLTPLMAAAEYNTFEIAELLLKHHADVTAENMYGETAIDIAAKKGHTKILELIRQYTNPEILKTGT